MDDATVEYSGCSEAGSADAAEAAALAEKIEKIRDLAERKRRTAFEFREQRKRRLAELRAEADACAASGVEMDQDRAAELDKILWAKHKQAEQTKENKIINEIKYKVTRKVSYEDKDKEIITYDSVPWPAMGGSAKLAIDSYAESKLLSAADKRKLVRQWARRWHPDTWGKYNLAKDDRESILVRVDDVSKKVNALLD